MKCYLLSFYDNWQGGGGGVCEVRGIQLQHDTAPLDVTTFYTLNL